MPLSAFKISISTFHFSRKNFKMDKNLIKNRISESIAVKNRILNDPIFLEKIAAAVELLTNCFLAGGKVLFCGNGGSAADAQHLAAELSGRFYKNRAALFAEALHVNGSFLTAVGNDFGFDKIYARMVEAAGRENDILVVLSTSGNSQNILEGIKMAQKIGLKTVALTGETGGKLASLRVNILLNCPSNDTPRIQEAHILVGHIICEMVEARVFEE
jgi:D-sedoheptulose 7-phosphate isomerase